MYTYRLLYQNLMVTTNQKSITNIQTEKKKESKYNTKNSHQITKKENKEERKNKKTYKNKSKTINKMAIRTYISTITLNVNGLNVPTKRHRLAESIQEQPYIYAVYKRPTSDLETHKD